MKPEIAFALMHEIHAYRRIRYRLQQKVTVAEKTKARESVQ